jgi:hypothetical protein
VLGKPLTTRHRYSVWRVLKALGAEPVGRVGPRHAIKERAVPRFRRDRTATIRQRRARRRFRNGVSPYRIEAHDSIVAVLIEVGRLSPEAALDTKQIERAITAVVDQWRVDTLAVLGVVTP